MNLSTKKKTVEPKSFKQLRVLIETSDESKKQELCEKIKELGGTVNRRYGSALTHIIFDASSDKKKIFPKAEAGNIPVVTPEWLASCVESQSIVAVDEFKATAPQRKRRQTKKKTEGEPNNKKEAGGKKGKADKKVAQQKPKEDGSDTSAGEEKDGEKKDEKTKPKSPKAKTKTKKIVVAEDDSETSDGGKDDERKEPKQNTKKEKEQREKEAEKADASETSAGENNEFGSVVFDQSSDDELAKSPLAQEAVDMELEEQVIPEKPKTPVKETKKKPQPKTAAKRKRSSTSNGKKPTKDSKRQTKKRKTSTSTKKTTKQPAKTQKKRKRTGKEKEEERPTKKIKTSKWIALTKFDTDGRLQMRDCIEGLGGAKTLFDEHLTEKTTHLVVGDPKRSIKVLEAIAKGIWVVHREWVVDSVVAGKWVDEKDYVVDEFPGAAISRNRREDGEASLFSGTIFMIHGETKINTEALKELITMAGGKLTSNADKADYCVVSELDTKKPGGYLINIQNHKKARVVKEEFVYDALQMYSMPEDVKAYELCREK
eukprot:CAMPEP_0174264560 /NCGR_PEP_ID=MMETSP0439-20130205/22871_1 /TAXON_ID=0 /ORGANISM="Stereomyxa ramosa, Strain Chinc5" /LENGTH=542 /DNA_ID=CAMNT_0015350487 /DNA_START=44 /DNA_END=1672 /DNA_ORIENTATION=+